MSGFLSSYDIIIGNPDNIEFMTSDNVKSKFNKEKYPLGPKKYLWNTKIRFITQDGKISKLTKSNGYGEIIYKAKKYYIIETNYLYSKENPKLKPEKIDVKQLRDNDVLIIHDYVYQILKKKEKFKKLKGKPELFKFMCKFYNRNNDEQLLPKQLTYLKPSQDFIVYSNDYISDIVSHKNFKKTIKMRFGKYSKKSKKQWKELGWEKVENGWNYLDPNDIKEDTNDYFLIEPKNNTRNKKRIEKLIKLFLENLPE